jgi:hypothetical protein
VFQIVGLQTCFYKRRSLGDFSAYAGLTQRHPDIFKIYPKWEIKKSWESYEIENVAAGDCIEHTRNILFEEWDSYYYWWVKRKLHSVN